MVASPLIRVPASASPALSLSLSLSLQVKLLFTKMAGATTTISRDDLESFLVGTFHGRALPGTQLGRCASLSAQSFLSLRYSNTV